MKLLKILNRGDQRIFYYVSGDVICLVYRSTAVFDDVFYRLP